MISWGCFESKRAFSAALSISASPILLFLYVDLPLSPTQVRTRPYLILETLSSFKLNHAMAPMVSGINKNL